MGNDYGTGYSVGKAKAHFEIRQWRPGNHSHDCGCEVCLTVRRVLTEYEYAKDIRKENERLEKNLRG